MTHLVVGDLVKLVGGQGSQDEEADKGAQSHHPYGALVLLVIHIAFNQLSNAQLEYWMDIQRQKIIDLVIESSEMETEQKKVEPKIQPKASQKEPEPVRAAKQDAGEKECR